MEETIRVAVDDRDVISISGAQRNTLSIGGCAPFKPTDRLAEVMAAKGEHPFAIPLDCSCYLPSSTPPQCGSAEARYGDPNKQYWAAAGPGGRTGGGLRDLAACCE